MPRWTILVRSTSSLNPVSNFLPSLSTSLIVFCRGCVFCNPRDGNASVCGRTKLCLRPVYQYGSNHGKSHLVPRNRRELYSYSPHLQGIAPTGIIVLVLLGRTLRHTTNAPDTLPSARAIHPADSRPSINYSTRSGSPPPLDFHGRKRNPHHIRIEIKSDTAVVLSSEHDTELDTLQKRHSSRRDEIWTPDQELDPRRGY